MKFFRLNMAVTSLVCVCSGCAYNYWDFIVNFYYKDNMGIDFLQHNGAVGVNDA